MKKQTFTVHYKKKLKIPKELLIYVTPETKFEICKEGFARGITPNHITAKPRKGK